MRIRKNLILSASLILMFFLSPRFTPAANWYVWKSAGGSNDGSNWTNAWNEMSSVNFSSVSCGDTIWLGGGTYTTQLSVAKSCTSGSMLTIESVLATDSVPTSATGYTTAVLNQVILSNNSISFGGAASYVTISGRQGTVLGDNFGISIQFTSPGYGIILSGSSTASNLTFSYIEVYGPACAASGTCTSTADGLAVHNGNAASITVDHCWLHQWAEIINNFSVNGFILQYSQLDTDNTTSAEHADLAYVTGGSNYTFRYNRFHTSAADGILFESGGSYSNMDWYGNSWFHDGGSLIDFKSGSTCSNVHLYNNVFQYDGYLSYQSFLYFQSDLTGTSAVEDNVFDGVTWDVGAIPTQDYNAFSTSVGQQDTGSHSFTYVSGGQFVNAPDSSNPNAADFHLTSSGASTFQPGISLSSPYNQDPDGNTRGANGYWYVGAYQYQTSGGSTPPATPAGLFAKAQWNGELN